MTDNPEVSEDTTERDIPEQDPPASPRGADGESRVVAERSGSDTDFPDRPLLADPDDARRAPGEERAEDAGQAKAEAEAADEGDVADTAKEERKDGSGSPEPEVGPAS